MLLYITRDRVFDEGVHPNGFTSPDLLHDDDDEDDDEDDCSSHASSSDWTPQPQIGQLNEFHPPLSVVQNSQGLVL